MKPFRPMLAVDAEELSALPYPLLASYKMDGIRCVITPEGPRTRSMKPIPNKHVQQMLSTLPVGLDGEIGVVIDGAVNFRETTSAVRRFEGEPEFRFFVFDNYLFEAPYHERYSWLWGNNRHPLFPDWVEIVTQHVITCESEVQGLFTRALEEGHEGLILRRADAPYKQGRSTLKEAYLLKVKPWKDAEARLIDIIPEFENTNEQFRDERGFAKRSSKQEGKVARDRAGVLVVQSDMWGNSFEIGTGMTHADKEEFWRERENLLGQLVRFKYVTVGGYDVPRHTVFQGFRMPEDV